MRYKELGTTGVKLPEIGLALDWCVDERRSLLEALRTALALDVSLVDFSHIKSLGPLFGKSAQAETLKSEIYAELKHIRSKIFLLTDCYLITKITSDRVLKRVDADLERMGTDHIDLLVLWLVQGIPLLSHGPTRLSHSLPEVACAVEELVDSGKVRFVGLYEPSLKRLQEVQQAFNKHRISAIEVTYNILERKIEKNLLPYCQQNNIMVLAQRPLYCYTLLTGNYAGHSSGRKLISKIAQETDKTISQVALSWLLSRPGVIAMLGDMSTGAKGWSYSPASRDVLAEYCAASDWCLSPEHINALDRAFH